MTSGQETFTLTLASAANHKFHREQIELKSAFVHANKKEGVFIKHTDGFVEVAVAGTKLVCTLNKSIHGLNQASKNVYDRFKKLLLDRSFQQSRSHFCLNVKSENSSFLLVLVWLDDIMVASCDLEQLNSLREQFEQDFKIEEKKKT